MIELIAAAVTFACEDSKEVVESIMRSQESTLTKNELIEVIKENTEPECYGSEQGDSSST